MSPDAVIQAIRSRGGDATELRDAAHEACHALACGVPDGKWDRDTIHRYVMRGGYGRAAEGEVVARLVEQEVCKVLGVVTNNIEHWLLVSCMEAIKFRLPFLSYDQAKLVSLSFPRDKVADLAQRICVLEALPQKRKRRKSVRAEA